MAIEKRDKDLDLAGFRLLNNGTPFSGMPAPTNVDGAVPRQTSGGAFALQRLTMDDIDPAFAISSFVANGFSLTQECGATIANPAFTAAFNATLSALTIGDGTHTDAIALGAQAAFGYNNGGTSGLPARSYTVNGVNATQIFTLTATKSAGPTKTATVTAAFRPRVYYDITTVPGALNAAFITGLAQSGLQGSFANTYALGAGAANKKIYIAWPTAYGTPNSVKDGNGFSFPMSKVASAVAVTNANSVAINYDIWASDNFIVPAFTVVVS